MVSGVDDIDDKGVVGPKDSVYFVVYLCADEEQSNADSDSSIVMAAKGGTPVVREVEGPRRGTFVLSG